TVSDPSMRGARTPSRRPTATISPSRTCTSPSATSPSAGSIVSTYAPVTTYSRGPCPCGRPARAGRLPLAAAGGTSPMSPTPAAAATPPMTALLLTSMCPPGPRVFNLGARQTLLRNWNHKRPKATNRELPPTRLRDRARRAPRGDPCHDNTRAARIVPRILLHRRTEERDGVQLPPGVTRGGALLRRAQGLGPRGGGGHRPASRVRRFTYGSTKARSSCCSLLLMIRRLPDRPWDHSSNVC